jgi:magnesium transporter
MTMMPTAAEIASSLRELLRADPGRFAESVRGMAVPDLAEALRTLPPEQATEIVCALPFELAVDLFDEPELEGHRSAIAQRLPRDEATRLIAAMSADQQADLLRELEPADRKRLLEVLDPATRQSLTALLAWPSDTAGGIMTTEFTAVPAEWTAARVLAHLRQVAETKETIYAVYVVEEGTDRLQHVVSLRELLQADEETPVRRVATKRRLITIPPGASRLDAARVIGKYNLLALPVVDETRRLLGIVTVDDVIDALVAEQTRQVQRLGGLEALDLPYTEMGFGAMIRKRAGWLCALFLGEMLTATAMGHFEDEIARAVVLSLFIPLIISSGGNSGSQATSLIIRALALRELALRDWWRVALRELPSGLMLGAILGAIGVVRILLWQELGWYDYGAHAVLVAVTVGLALVGVVTFGSMAGSLLPFLLRRLGFDPASASAPFVATLVDVTGLVIYFSVALLVLRGTLL